MKLNFFKMHARGNDYIYFDFREKPLPNIDLSTLAQKLSNRRFNIGSDGIVIIEMSHKADAKMRIFNANGSEAEMCGSALQCVIHHLSDQNEKTDFQFETASGIKTGTVISDSKKVKICLGKPFLLQNEKTIINGYEGNLVDVGNPHFVTFTENIDLISIAETGKQIESDKLFIDGVNVEFIEIVSKNEVIMKVWERGSGVTLSCGTGSCASVYAGIVNKKLDNSVKLHSPGGEVIIDYDGSNIFLTGEVEYVYSGEVEV